METMEMNKLRERVITAVLRREKAQAELLNANKEIDVLLALNKEIDALLALDKESDLLADYKMSHRKQYHAIKGRLMNGGVADQIYKKLYAQPERIFSAGDLISEGVDGNKSAVLYIMSRMAMRGQIFRFGKGRYQAIIKQDEGVLK